MLQGLYFTTVRSTNVSKILLKQKYVVTRHSETFYNKPMKQYIIEFMLMAITEYDKYNSNSLISVYGKCMNQLPNRKFEQ